MSTPTVDLMAQVLGGGAPAVVMLGPNQRVRTPAGFLGTVADSLTFSHGGPGYWIVGNQRTRAAGVFTVASTASGMCLIPAVVPVPAPVMVATGNPRVKTS